MFKMLHTLNGKVSAYISRGADDRLDKPLAQHAKKLFDNILPLRMRKAVAESDLKIFMGKANARSKKCSRKRAGISAKAYGNPVRQGPQDRIKQEQPCIFKSVA
jgi:hypothetical protein